MNKVSLNGVEIFPFDSEQQLLSFVDKHKGILVAINAEKNKAANPSDEICLPACIKKM